VFGVLPGIIGTIQATETIKLILGVGESLAGRLLLVDTLGMQFRTMKLRRDPECPACGTREIRELIDYEHFCGVTSAQAADSGASSSAASDIAELSPRELAARLARGDDFDLIDVREPFEWEIARIEGARLIPLGTLDAAVPELDPSRELVLYCKGGVRSLKAALELRAAGFTRLSNVTGGISRWSEEVDPAVARY